MLVQSRIKGPRRHPVCDHHRNQCHSRPEVLPGPGLEGDYFEIKNEALLIQKLNAVFNQQLIIPPLLPSRKVSEKTFNSENDDPETFLLSTLKDVVTQQQGKNDDSSHVTGTSKNHEKQHMLKAPPSPDSSSSPVSVSSPVSTSTSKRSSESSGHKSSGQKTTSTAKTVKRKNDENQKQQEQQQKQLEERKQHLQMKKHDPPAPSSSNTGLQLKTKLQAVLQRKGDTVAQTQQEEHIFHQQRMTKSQHKQEEQDLPYYINNGRKIVIHFPHSASFSSSIHEKDDTGDNANSENCIEVTVPQHYATFPLKHSSSFSSSIHDNHDLDEINESNDDFTHQHEDTKRKKEIKDHNHAILNKVEMFQKFQTLDELEDFKRINNFTAEGDYLLSRILRERSRIQFKKDMLQSERELYVRVQTECRKSLTRDYSKGDASVNTILEERKILFYC